MSLFRRKREKKTERNRRLTSREKIKFYSRIIVRLCEETMSESGPPPTVLQMLERNVGRKIMVILDPSYGFEGTLVAVTREPPGIWLSNADAVIMRATIAQPLPHVVGKENRSEVFIHLNSVQRIEILHKSQ